MMWGGWNNMMGYWNGLAGCGSSGVYGLLSQITWIGLLVLIFLAIVKLWQSINKSNKR